MAKPEHVKCGNCIFFTLSDDADFGGFCQRYAPRRSQGNDLLQALGQIHWAVSRHLSDAAREEASQSIERLEYKLETFQSVSEDEWCGDFRAEWPT